MFADLTGYTTLSSRLDPEEVHRILERFFDVADGAVAQYGGSIDKHIGDNVMALFGAPVAHDDDPERAVRAALAIQAGVAELSQELGFDIGVHIGVAAGEVVASSLGSRHHQAYTVTGNAVNLAARLQDKAKSGETLIDDGVRSAVAAVARATLVGDVEVKGLERPVRVWKLVGLRAERWSMQRPFVGRASELARLRGALKRCLEGRRGEALCLRGEPGIGKSRLAREVLTEATAQDVRCQVAPVLDFGAGRERDAIATLVRGVLDLDANASAANAARGAVTDADLAFVCDLAGDPVPEEDRARFESMDDAAHGAGRRRALTALLRSQASARPTLLLIEDVHWADAETLDLLSAAAGSTADVPLVLLMTSRHDGFPLDDDFRARAGVAVTTLDLGPLDSDECAELAMSLASGSDERTASYVDRSGGNPLFLEQLLTADGPTSQGVPATLKSLVLARVDRLPRREQATIRAASVLGQRFGADLLQAVLEMPPALDGLLARGMVRREAEDVVFAHALIRDGVYGSLTRAERRALHLAAARAVDSEEPTLRAEHLDRAEHPDAAASYLEAAKAEARRHHYHRALPLLGRAKELATDPVRHAVLAEEGRVRLELSDGAQAVRAFGDALACAPDDAARCHALIGAAAGHRLLSNYDAALEALADAEAIAAPAKLTRELARLHYYRGNIVFPMGDAARCHAEHSRALEHARRLDDGELQARAHSGLGDAAYTAGNFAEAETQFRRCIELCRTHGLLRFTSVNLIMLGHVLQIRGDCKTALASMREALADVTSLADRYGEMFARQSLGLALALTGNLEASRIESEAARELALELGAKRYVPESEALLADVLFELGEFDRAEKIAAQAAEGARATGLAYCGPLILGILGRVTRDAGLRARCFEEGAALLGRAVGAHNPLIFHRAGIDAGHGAGDAPMVLHHATALEKWAGGDGASLASLFAERGRFLASRIQGRDEDPTPLVARARAMGVILCGVS